VGLSMKEKKAVTKQMAKRYSRASKALKGQILDELCALTSWTRRHARRALGTALKDEPARPRKQRAKIYGKDVLEPMRFVWAALGGPAGKRLAPFMGEAVEALERHGELKISDDVKIRLLKVSAATIDRALAQERRRLRIKGRQGTKPGSILKRQIPIRTFADWNENRPGFCEVDLVAHDGGSSFGEFCQTLDLVCIATGWTEMRAIQTKAQRWVLEAIIDVRQSLPFPLLGLDCDNGSEFINVELFKYCIKEGITFTRSRPYRKNDNCFVEQKNWPVVRQQVGYLRYDTAEELEVLRKMYGYLRLYMNFFQPQMKLISKSRNGAKVVKKFDLAQTPYQRVLVSAEISERTKQKLTTLYKDLNPAQLKRDLIDCQDQLLKISATKTRKEVKPPPGQAFRDRRYSWKYEDIIREATGGI